MFKNLTTVKLQSVMEDVQQNPSNCQPQCNPPQPPPMRFGAVKIPLEPDPDQSQIKIIEYSNSFNTNDYQIFINGLIRGSATYYAEFLTLLNTLTNTSSVYIYISSPGGSLYTGAMIANAIKNSEAEIATIACGIVASAAALIWSYGDIRQVMDNAVVLFHMSSHGDWGNSEAIKIRAENVVRYVKEICIDPMVEQGILTLDEAETIIDKRRDVLINAEMMKPRLEKFHDQIK